MPQFLKVSWFLRMSPSLLEGGFEFSPSRRVAFASRRDWITSSTLALERDSGGKKRPWIFEKSCFFVLLISPKTASMSSWDVTTTQARRGRSSPILR